jgi:hypothetical protein
MKASECAKAVQWAIEAKRPILLEGAPGIGKSAIIAQVTQKLGFPLCDVRAVLLDPVDLRGLPHINGDQRAHWCPPAFLPDSGEGVLFLDELPQAAPLVQSACLQLTLDRRIGEYELPDGWAVVAAGNRQQDRTGAHRLIEALRDRFVCLTLDVSVEDWQAWAVNEGISPVVRSFIEYRPTLLHRFDPEQQAQAYPTPRSWSKVSLMQQGVPDELMHEMVAGCVGEAAAVEFMAFRQICQQLPAIDSVLANPLHATVPSEPAVLYALSGALTERLRGADAGVTTAFCHYVNRWADEIRKEGGREFATLAYRDGVQANRKLLNVPEADTWVRKHRHLLTD